MAGKLPPEQQLNAFNHGLKNGVGFAHLKVLSSLVSLN